MEGGSVAPVPSVAPGGSRSPRPLLALLLLATAIVYLPALPGEFVWDDRSLIVDNPNVRDASRLLKALTHDFWHVPTSLEGVGDRSQRYYRPVVTLAYWLECRVFGLAPLGFHLVNLTLHLVCVALVFGWLQRRIEGPETFHAQAVNARALGPLAGAAVFALHPSRPESVAWISGSTDLWLTLFALLGLRAWESRPGPRGAVQAAVFFALAMLSKETAVVLPLLLLIDLFVLRAPGGALRPLLFRWALAASGVASALALRLMVMRVQVARSVLDRWEQTPERVLSTLGHFVWDTFMPWWPSIHRTLRVMVAGRTVYDRGSIALGMAVLAGVVVLASSTRRRPELRPYLADGLWYLVALLPTLNVLPLGLQCQTALRFLYLPLLGVCAILARAVATRGAQSTSLWRGGVAALVVAMGLVSTRHAASFVDDDTLWSTEVKRNPNNPIGHFLLAASAMRRGDLRTVEARLHRSYLAAIHNGDGDGAVRAALTTADFLLSTTPDDDRPTLEAVRDFLDAFDADTDGLARLHTERLRIGLRLRREETAMRRRMHVDVNRGWVYFRLGDEARAEATLREAARRPDAFTARRRLALVLATQGRFTEADTLLASLLRENPSDLLSHQARATLAAHVNALGHAPDAIARQSLEARFLADMTRPQRAREILRPLHEAHPDRPEPVDALVHAELVDGRRDAAERVVREALARAPTLTGRLRPLPPSASR